ncbi:MAG: methyltransferase domain-containing protein [Rubrobacter sp.]|nr:methyltransferase domain-containing protein [Rubrobacter sp.]
MSERSKEATNSVDIARDYYNSDDADGFYSTIWGGEDIHVGLYKDESEPIFDASRRTVERMASRLDGLDENARVLDIGAGYGGAARHLAGSRGCRVAALNLSEVENERNRSMNEEANLGHLIEVVDGSFEEVPFEDGSFDIVWSQDAILHSGEREKVIEEVGRVLKDGGEFVFTDPMQSDECPEDVLQPILDRIHLDTLGSPGFYREMASRFGMKELAFEDHTKHLATHYARVLEETEKREDKLSGVTSKEYIERMKAGLRHWVDGGREGHLVWGIFHFGS